MSHTEHHKIVILDNDQHRRDLLKSMLTVLGYRPFLFEKESCCLDNISLLDPDLVISGSLAANKIYRFINTIKSTSSALPIVIISDDEAISDFVITNGFDDISVINENLNPAAMQGTISEKLKNHSNKQPRQDCPLLIGNTPEMVKIKNLIPRLNKLNETALIKGERGTGKDLLARVIHSKSDRHDKPFVKIDAREFLTDTTEDNQMNGEPISLQTASNNQKQLLALISTGTLFLDEIGVMTPALQAQLLQFLEKFRIWSLKQGAYDIRLITSTTIDLESMVAGGQFRKDLYYRLSVIKIEMPPLRRRIEDIPPLADFFTDKFCHQLGKSYYGISSKTKDIFSSYYWPGNVKELESLVRDIVAQGEENHPVKKLLLLSENDRLLNNLEGFISPGEIARVKNYVEDSKDWSLKDIGQKLVNRLEKRLVKKVLESTNWNRKKAAKLLDISYKSLLSKIKDYNLN